MNSNEKRVVKIVVWIFILIALITVAFASFENIQEGERGVVTRFDKLVRIEEPGIVVVPPFVYDIIPMSVRIVKLEAHSEASSKDLQDVTTDLAVQYQVIDTVENITRIFKVYKSDIDKTVVEPAIQEATKSATAKYSAEELITKRPEVKKDIIETLAKRLELEGLRLSNVDIVNFRFSPAFNQAIEQKVKAEQDALTAKNKLEQVKYEAEQKVAKAEAEAKRIELEALSLRANGEDIIAKIIAEAQLEAARRWNGVLPQQMIPGGTIPFIQLGK